jgi:hypothetical protein
VKVKIMPKYVGKYTVTILSKTNKGKQLYFTCTLATANNFGIVQAKGTGFVYSNQKSFHPLGTTCYAWVHQPLALQEQTIQTLQQFRFNKMRMTVFPKTYEWTNNEPLCFPFTKENGAWNYDKPNPIFF